MNAASRAFQSAYGAALAAHLARPGEPTLQRAYELGRSAVDRGVGLVEMAAVHHDVLAAALRESMDRAEVERLVEAAGDIFLESLSAYEMVVRGFGEARAATAVERRRAAIIRRLSTFLADASVAADADASVQEILQLVAEQAREAVGARRCRVAATFEGDAPVSAETGERAALGATTARPFTVERQLTTLGGRCMGQIALERDDEGFTLADNALLLHIAEMTSAALERLPLYRDASRRARG